MQALVSFGVLALPFLVARLILERTARISGSVAKARRVGRSMLHIIFWPWLCLASFLLYQACTYTPGHYMDMGRGIYALLGLISLWPLLGVGLATLIPIQLPEGEPESSPGLSRAY